MSALLTTNEVAEHLGVKPATVYAYVSRGLLSPVREPGRRGSRFAAQDVEEFVSGAGRTTSQGLVIESEITLIEDGHYWYRGHDAVALATDLPFESVADVLWTGTPMPTRWGRSDQPILMARAGAMGLPQGAGFVQRMQGMLVALGADPLAPPLGPDSIVPTGRGTIATIVRALGDNAASPGDRSAARPTVASALALALGNRRAEPVIDVALGLVADHGLAASTTAVRVAAGFGASIQQALLAGLATHGAPLHGGATTGSERFLADALRRGIPAAVSDAVAGTGRLTGLGHPFYASGDPRYRALRDQIARRIPASPVVSVLDELEGLCDERGWPAPNVDLGLAALTAAFDLAAGSGEALFAIGRMAGWVAHAAEAADAERIRPRARYVGRRP